MSHYQSLLDEAVRLVEAERGFIVLSKEGAHHYEATHNFDPIQNRYSDKMFFDLLADLQPILTDNSITQQYLPRGVVSTLSLRCVLVGPLKKEGTAYGLLWCDRVFQQGLFSREDLANLVALAEKFHEPS